MIEVIAERPIRHRQMDDQAAGLRRLFGPQQARLLPVLCNGGRRAESPWLAQLGEAFARSGQRTLLIDAARLQVAARFGLRARFDLMHALDGDCPIADVRLEAATGLVVVPAARAFAHALTERVQLSSMLAHVTDDAVDVVLLLLPAAYAQSLPAGDVLVPVLPTRESVASAAALIVDAAGRQGTLSFRLLFLAMQRAAATTLGKRMAESIGVRSRALLRCGAVAPLPRDLALVVAAAGEFALSHVAAACRVGSGGTR
jgi:flagellar biosynthesis protein FlhG